MGSLENVLQNDASLLALGTIECPEKADPYEVFAKNIKEFRQYQPQNKQVLCASRRTAFLKLLTGSIQAFRSDRNGIWWTSLLFS